MRYPLFGLLDVPQLEILRSAGQEVSFSTGETIFQEGTLGAWVHVVLHGKVRIFRRTPQGNEKTLGLAQGGNYSANMCCFARITTLRPAAPLNLPCYFVSSYRYLIAYLLNYLVCELI